jgi:hypothetical protein
MFNDIEDSSHTVAAVSQVRIWGQNGGSRIKDVGEKLAISYRSRRESMQMVFRS